MRKKTILYSVAVLIILSLITLLFAGCTDQKDVYGAASDYIRVSHPDETDDVNSGLSDKSDEEVSSDETVTSDVFDTSDTGTPDNGDSSSGSDSGQSTTIGDGFVIPPIEGDSKPIEGDMGPIITF